jgi:hypothetical protein
MSLPPFAMWPAFPTSDYYEGSVPSWRHQLTTSLPATRLAGGQEGGPQDGSHVHHATGRRDRCPAIPLQPRHGYAAGLHRGLLAGHHTRCWSRLPHTAAGVRCCPAHIHQIRAGAVILRGFDHWFLRRTPLRLACRARAVWQCRPVPSLSRLLPTRACASRLRLPPASMACCDRPQVGPCTPPGCMAPRGAHGGSRTA